MRIDGFNIAEGGSVQNFSVPTGTSFPALPNYGEIFYRDDESRLYVYSTTGSTWVGVAAGEAEISKWLIDTADKIYRAGDVGVGATPLAGNKLYVLGDVQLDGSLVLGANQITSTATPTLADHLVNKNYFDGFMSGVIWDSPIRHANLIDDSLSTPPGSPTYSDVYVVSGTGAGAWTGLDGKLVQWDGSTWIDQGILTSGMRFGIAIDTTTVPAGSFVGSKNSLATYNGTTFDIVAPIDKRAMFVSYAGSLHAWRQYVYEVSAWIEFGGPNVLGDGDNLQLTANRLDVVGGTGSGLDLDTIDGSHLSDLDAKYLQKDLSNVMTGDLSVAGNASANKFVIAGVDQILTSTAAVDSVIYDTALDSDGGQWRYLKKSWSSEPVPSGKYLGRFSNESAARSAGGTNGDWYSTTGATQFVKLEAVGETQIYRAGRSEFPVKVLVVAESTQVVIYDLTQAVPEMWMVFVGVSGPLFWAGGSTALTGISVMHGYISVVGGASTGIVTINFASDEIKLGFDSSNYGLTSDRSVVGRNTSPTFTATSNGYRIVSRNVNDTAMTILPDAPIDSVTGLKTPTIVVGTDGGVSVIADSGAVYDITFTQQNGSKVFGIEIRDGLLYMLLGYSDVSPYCIYVLTLSAVTSDMALTVSDRWYDATGGTDLLGATNYITHNTGGGPDGLTFRFDNIDDSLASTVAYSTTDYATGWLPGDIRTCLLADSNVGNIVGSELITNGTFDSDVSGWTLKESGGTFAATGGEGVLTYVTAATSYQQVFATTIGETYTISFDFVGGSSAIPQLYYNDSTDVIITISGIGSYAATFVAATTSCRVFPRVGAVGTGIFDNISCRLAVDDRSVKGNGVQVFGTLTKSLITPDSDLVAYSGFSASNYIEQHYNSDLDFGVNQFSLQLWANLSGSVSQRIFERSFVGSGNRRWFLWMNADGTILWKFSNDVGAQFGITTSASYNDGLYHHYSCERDNVGNWSLYIDNVLVGSYIMGLSQTFTNSGAILSLGITPGGGAPLTNGSIALFRSSATVPTAGQRKHMYETERQMINGKALLGGTSNAVTALDFDKSRNELSAGTSIGKSVFNNLTRVDYQAASNITSLSSYQDIEFVGKSSGSDIKIPEIDVRAEVMARSNPTSEDNSWTDITLLNNWLQFTGYQTAQYRKVGDTVEIRGLIKDGTLTSGTVIFTLPSGYHPTQPITIPIQAAGGVVGTIDILSNGEVKLTITNSTWVSLGGIEFSI